MAVVEMRLDYLERRMEEERRERRTLTQWLIRLAVGVVVTAVSAIFSAVVLLINTVLGG